VSTGRFLVPQAGWRDVERDDALGSNAGVAALQQDQILDEEARTEVKPSGITRETKRARTSVRTATLTSCRTRDMCR
jgi:hypothetical protein